MRLLGHAMRPAINEMIEATEPAIAKFLRNAPRFRGGRPVASDLGFIEALVLFDGGVV